MIKCTLKNSSIVAKKAKLSALALMTALGITMGALSINDTILIRKNNQERQELSTSQNLTIIKITSDSEFQKYLNEKIAVADRAKEEGFLSDEEYSTRIGALSSKDYITSKFDSMTFLPEELKEEMRSINGQLELNSQKSVELRKQEVLHTVSCAVPLCGIAAYIMDKLDKRKQRDNKQEVNFEMTID